MSEFILNSNSSKPSEEKPYVTTSQLLAKDALTALDKKRASVDTTFKKGTSTANA